MSDWHGWNKQCEAAWVEYSPPEDDPGTTTDSWRQYPIMVQFWKFGTKEDTPQ